MAAGLHHMTPTERLCGAEINSAAALLTDGKDYLELSTTGQIFHETFRSRFRQSKATRLPRPATRHEKQRPRLASHGYGQAEAPRASTRTALGA